MEQADLPFRVTKSVFEEEEPTFLCDAMLGGLAKWLRAAGYRALFDVHARDGELVRRAHERGYWLLTSDSGIMERHAVSQGYVRTVFVPRGSCPVAQLGHVLGVIGIGLRAPRCMACGGRLVPVELAEVRSQVPPKVREHCRDYFVCCNCAGVYWRGSHWESIQARLRRAMALAGGSREKESGDGA